MHNYIIFKILLILFALTSCKSTYVKSEAYKNTTQKFMLGVIGEQKNFLIEQDYNHTAIPDYKTPIKVVAEIIPFTKKSFKTLTKAKEYQKANIEINYVDSLPNKPVYLKLEIADRVAILNALNSKENKTIFQFLETNTKSVVITSLVLILPQSEITSVIHADEVFLEPTGIKSYGLKLYTNKEYQQTINFKNSIIFGYQFSHCCWQENDKYQLEIVDLAEGHDDCPNGTTRYSKRAKKEINYYKF